MRIIGLDIHRAFAEAVAWENDKLTRLGRIDMRRDRLTAFAASLPATDVVVVEATGNAAAVADVIGRHVKRVVIANPKQVRIIAHAKIKTDTIDAGVLAQLYASGFLPEVWIADAPTQALRRQVTRRNQIVRQRTQLKNIMQSILHAHLLRHQSHQSSTQDVESSSQGINILILFLRSFTHSDSIVSHRVLTGRVPLTNLSEIPEVARCPLP